MFPKGKERSSRTHGGVRGCPCQLLLMGRATRLAAVILLSVNASMVEVIVRLLFEHILFSSPKVVEVLKDFLQD
jgi:hypothetical protein